MFRWALQSQEQSPTWQVFDVWLEEGGQWVGDGGGIWEDVILVAQGLYPPSRP